MDDTSGVMSWGVSPDPSGDGSSASVGKQVSVEYGADSVPESMCVLMRTGVPAYALRLSTRAGHM